MATYSYYSKKDGSIFEAEFPMGEAPETIVNPNDENDICEMYFGNPPSVVIKGYVHPARKGRGKGHSLTEERPRAPVSGHCIVFNLGRGIIAAYDSGL